MAKSFLKIGMKTKIIAGQFRGSEAVVTGIKGDYVTVSGIPGLKRTVKADPRTQTEGGFKEVKRKIHKSNVKPIKAESDKGVNDE